MSFKFEEKSISKESFPNAIILNKQNNIKPIEQIKYFINLTNLKLEHRIHRMQFFGSYKLCLRFKYGKYWNLIFNKLYYNINALIIIKTIDTFTLKA
jgi:hypothetical protein